MQNYIILEIIMFKIDNMSKKTKIILTLVL